MPLIVDGNNLLHSLPRADRNRSEVRRQVLEAVRQQRVRVTVVFDGPPPTGTPELEHLGSVTVRYSGKLSADKVILDLVAAGNAADWVVISDDRELRNLARERGAAVRSLGEWKGRRSKPGRRAGREPKLSSHEVAEWESYFSAGREKE
jgi:hypothetical protein